MNTDRDAAATLTVTETRSVPSESLILGAGAMVPFPVGAAVAFAGGAWGELAATLAVLWGGAILCFLAGVRRGVSFRTPGGPTAAQLGIMLVHYSLGASALFIVALALGTAAVPPLGLAAILLALGYGTMIVADPAEAEQGTMPLHFARLRPVQMLVPTVSLAVIAVYAFTR